MKYLTVAFSLLATPLLADCSWELGIRMGYRWDDLSHTLFEPDNPTQSFFQEHFDHLNTAQIAGFATLRLWWLQIGADANYGWTVGGDIKTTQSIDLPPLTIMIPAFKSDANGEVWDAFLTGGVRLPCYAGCAQNVSITAWGGYSFHGIREKRRNLHPHNRDIGATEILGTPSDPTFASLPHTQRLERDYQGPFAGVDLSVCHCHFYGNCGYAYHWIDLVQTIAFTQQIKYFTQSGLVTRQRVFTNNYGPNRNRGNRGWLSLNYQDLCNWRVGVRGTYFSVFTKKRASQFHLTDTLTTPNGSEQTQERGNQRAKARWRTFTVMVEGSTAF